MQLCCLYSLSINHLNTHIFLQVNFRWVCDHGFSYFNFCCSEASQLLWNPCKWRTVIFKVSQCFFFFWIPVRIVENVLNYAAPPPPQKIKQTNKTKQKQPQPNNNKNKTFKFLERVKNLLSVVPFFHQLQGTLPPSTTPLPAAFSPRVLYR